MKHRKCQITIFFLLGLVLLVGSAFIIYLNNKPKTEESPNIPYEATPIKLFVENCIRETGKNALLHIGKHGGYYETKEPYLIDEKFDLPYYLYNNLDFSPSLNDIEAEISKYVDDNLLQCIGDFQEFRKQGFDVKRGIPSSSTLIGENIVSFDLSFPIEIKKGNSKQKIERFNVNLNGIHLKNVYNVTKEIVNFQYENSDKLCLTCIYQLSKKTDLYIDLLNYRNNSIIFIIKDYNITSDRIMEKPYNFTFAIKYAGISCGNINALEDPDLVQECIELKTNEK